MKKRISDLLNGKIKYVPDSFEVSDGRIEGKVCAGNPFRGKFSIKAQEGKSIQGFLYSSNVRMGFAPAMFYSTKETFTYEADTKGLMPGDTVEGTFYICSSAGEFQIPYCIQIEEKKEERPVAMGMTAEAFAEIAREDFSRAYLIFLSKDFPKMLEQWGPEYAARYEGIRARSVSYHSLEQFLVGSGLKQPIHLCTESSHVYLHDVDETTKEELILTKNTWGFAELQISWTGDFLSIERTRATTEEFVGSMYNVSYMIHQERLHAGRNFARIRVAYGSEITECVIEVRKAEELISKKELHQQKLEITRMLSAYIDYRAQRTGEKEWIGLSLSNLENYRKAGGNHIFFDLFEIYLRSMNGEQLEAELQMQQIQQRKEELVVPQWKGCYLYLSALANGEREYVEYIQEELSKLYLENQENWILQWLMFRMNGHLIRNDSEKLDLIRRQFLCGCKSPILYLDAVDILKNEPLMLRSLGDFEVHLLRFLCREHLLDREICGQTAQLACRCQQFEPVLFDVLCRCFEVFPSKNMLTAVCTMLIKGHKNQREYRKWFELGVHQDVRITGLYEYYVETMEELNDKMLPQSVRMYFIYHNTLDYTKKAAIYANIIKNRSRDPQTYENYRQAMELFMEEQLRAGRINRDLALLYDSLLTRMVLDVPMAEGLEKVLFTYELQCVNPRMHHVIVNHEQFRQEQRVQLCNGRAYVRIYSPFSSILLEDGDGKRYGDAKMYKVERLLNRPMFEEYCRELLEAPAGLIISDCCSQSKEVMITADHVSSFVKLLKLDEIRDHYKHQIRQKMVTYYGTHPETEGVEEFLNLVTAEQITGQYKKEYMELLVKEGRCDQAYDVICRYGAEKVLPSTLVRICSYQVEKAANEENRLLLALCAQCFLSGVYEEQMLKYLIRFYEGPIENMKRLWRAGRGFDLELFALEERILVMLLFVQQGLAHTEEIFTSYWMHQGKAVICRAYISLMAYHFFVKKEEVGQAIFAYMEQEMLGNVQTTDVCRLALLKYYASLDKLEAGQAKWREYLLGKYVSEGKKFAFYSKFPERLKREYHLQDKFVVEYRTNPAANVTLHYQINDEKEKSILLADTFEGIFTKEFTLFYQDCLTWYFTVESGGKKTETAKQSWTYQRRSPRGSVTKYELLNRLTETQQKGQTDAYQEVLEQYIGQQYLVEQLFPV